MTMLDTACGPLPPDPTLHDVNAKLEGAYRVLHGASANAGQIGKIGDGKLGPSHDMEVIREHLEMLRDAIDQYLKG